MVTPFHGKYYANQLLLKKSYSDDSRLSSSLFDAALNINPHQVNAALFAFNSPLSKGVLLADEVGLGKTIEAGLVLCQLWAEGKRRLLVICPAALRKQWSLELQEKFNLPSIILDSASYKQYVKEYGVSPFSKDNIFIMSYNYASKISNNLLSYHFYLAVLDEAHKLRNSYRTSNKLGQSLVPAIKGIRKILLTATPMQNNLAELFGLASVIDEYIFGDIKSFRANYIGSENLDDLKNRLSQFCNRTLRKDVMEYVKYTARHPIVFRFTPSKLESTLYEKISNFLQREDTYAVPVNQRHIVTLVVRKVLASSTSAVINTLEVILARLISLREKIAGKMYNSNDLKHGFSLEGDDDLYSLMVEELEEGYSEDEEDIEIEDVIDISRLDREIEEVRGFLEMASFIKKDAKAEKLLSALDTGFKQTLSLGGNRKALIFTESTRTQKFLKEFLEENGYKGRIVLFNGSNSGAETTAIYNDWLERNKYTGRCSGSKTADKRNALIEYFRDSADIMIATDCISEGQNLQDCDYLINYDIHWNPVRIIQRFGRIDRIGSKNECIQLVNFWPDINLDEYINLKATVETRMRISVMTATGDDDLINENEKGDLEYRRLQLERLKNEIVDIEDMTGGVSIMDLGLNEFRLDLLDYMKTHNDIEHAPYGMHAVVQSSEDFKRGAIYILKNRVNDINIQGRNRLHPFYMVYILEDGSLLYNHLQPKELLDVVRYICKGKEIDRQACNIFNTDTSDGKNMAKYSSLLTSSIESMVTVQEESNVESFLKGKPVSFIKDNISGIDDFELICFIAVV